MLVDRLVNWMVRRAYHATNRGDLAGATRNLADDVCLIFPGSSSWAGEYRGKAAVEGFVRRVVALGLQYEVHEVLTRGPLWDMTLALVISDHARDEAGKVVYSNRAVEICKVRWGKIYRLEIYEDTERSLAWDRIVAPTPTHGAIHA